MNNNWQKAELAVLILLTCILGYRMFIGKDIGMGLAAAYGSAVGAFAYKIKQ